MAVTGACWTAGGHRYPEIDRKPCPWIRNFWDLSALAEVHQLDKIISMDTYTSNSSEFTIDLMQYQYFFPIERVGVGMCPLGCGHSTPTTPCIASRIAAAVRYGAAELDMWALWDSTAVDWNTVRRAWKPWIAPLRSFLAGANASTIEGQHQLQEQQAQAQAQELCWNDTTTARLPQKKKKWGL